MKHALYGRVSFAWTVGDGTEHEKRAAKNAPFGAFFVF